MGPRSVAALLFLVAACEGRAQLATDEPAVPGTPSEGALRLVTFNAWGVPFRERHEALLEAVPRALDAYEPDVILLQEIWFEEDAQRLAAGFAEVGYPHEVHRASEALLAFDSAGLMIVSRWPLSRETHAAFRAGRIPVRPWHVDWFSAKGVISARVEHPDGPVHVGTVHLQADYEGAVYTDVRIAQTAELVEVLRRRRIDVLAGDFNSLPQALEHRVAREALGLRSAAVRGVDDILVGSAVRVRDAWAMGSPTVELDGTTMALSDHAILVADLTMVDGERGSGELSPALRTDLEAWWADRERFRALKRTAGWAAILLGLFLVGASAANRKRGGRRLTRLVLLVLALLSAVGAYRGIGAGTARDHWRASARATLLDR